jgi:hypothetical protein
MGSVFYLRFQLFLSQLPFIAAFLSFLFCPFLWAAQDAVVAAERALIYADDLMTSPIGYVRKGKKIKIGDIPRNRAQVYPIIVSGKVAYIKALDVNHEKQSMDSNVLVAERFQKGTQDEYKTNYSVSFFNFSSQIGLSKQNDEVQDQDPVDWLGLSVRGGVELKKRHDLDLYLNYLNAKQDDEVFRAVEFGPGWGYRVLETNRFLLKFTAQALMVPFATYSVGELFRVNGYGFSTGAGANANIRMGKHFGMEVYGGFFYSKLFGFDPPPPYQSISPSFMGTRLGVGITYQL